MQNILAQLNKIAGIRGSVVIGADGLVIASDLSGKEDPQMIGAVLSTVLSTATTTLTKLDRGELNGYILSGTNGHAAAWTINSQAHLLVLLREDINMGMVLLEIKTSVTELRKEMQL